MVVVLRISTGVGLGLPMKVKHNLVGNRRHWPPSPEYGCRYSYLTTLLNKRIILERQRNRYSEA